MRATRREFLKASVATLAMGRLARGREPGFRMPIGVCTSTKNAGLLKEAGASYIEAGVRWFLVPDKNEEAFAENLALAEACDLPVAAANGFLPGSLKSTGPEADHEGVLAFAETAFKRASRVGIKHIVFGSSGSRRVPDGFDHRTAELQFVALLARMAPLAKANDVIVVVEPLNQGEVNFINTLHDGARLVEPIGHPNIRLLADLFHMLRMDEPPQHIRDVGHLLAHTHIAEKGKRTPPGVDGDDFTPYFQALKDAGYNGGMSIECGWKDMEAQLPKAMKTLGEQMARVR
jgi:sugar phosphate isomerase/epimerase